MNGSDLLCRECTRTPPWQPIAALVMQHDIGLRAYALRLCGFATAVCGCILELLRTNACLMCPWIHHHVHQGGHQAFARLLWGLQPLPLRCLLKWRIRVLQLLFSANGHTRNCY